MDEPTLAEILLTTAERDRQAFAKLAEDLNLHDSLCGFHAQQAVEKGLKAVLAHAGVVFRHTHDIAELLDLLDDAGIAAPPHADHLDELTRKRSRCATVCWAFPAWIVKKSHSGCGMFCNGRMHAFALIVMAGTTHDDAQVGAPARASERPC
jgi:hypothetical protein